MLLCLLALVSLVCWINRLLACMFACSFACYAHLSAESSGGSKPSHAAPVAPSCATCADKALPASPTIATTATIILVRNTATTATATTRTTTTTKKHASQELHLPERWHQRESRRSYAPPRCNPRRPPHTRWRWKGSSYARGTLHIFINNNNNIGTRYLVTLYR